MMSAACSVVIHFAVFVCFLLFFIFFFKQKTAYEMRISDWSSDVCSSDLVLKMYAPPAARATAMVALPDGAAALTLFSRLVGRAGDRLTAFEFMTRSCLDLVQSHLPGVTVPFAHLPPAIVLAGLIVRASCGESG